MEEVNVICPSCVTAASAANMEISNGGTELMCNNISKQKKKCFHSCSVGLWVFVKFTLFNCVEVSFRG